ncbi:MAG TPA: sialate O-acetylesterase [Ferruginibacter sp.]|nr:sialate O-acetylesterase [Ferruginibacter sp.]HPH89340.1 sialate O-acetylesterase [Ferruginibacter sp.]
MQKRSAIILYYFILTFSCKTGAQIKLPAIVRDSMILQRDAPVNIWGWASPGEKISILLNKKKYTVKADTNGRWKTTMSPTKAGGPYTIELNGKNKITIRNVLFGDVWFCSGQSNMVHQLNIHDVRYAKEIVEANYPDIRQFWVPNTTNLQSPQEDLAYSNWQEAVGEKVRPFSAVAYFFARKLYETNHVPIGIINASVGGPPIESWTSEEGLKDFNETVAVIQQNKDTAYISSVIAKEQNYQPAIHEDLGKAGVIKWYEMNYKPSGWRDINIPGYWEDQGIKDLNGVVWYRKEITIPASMTGKNARIFLGRIVDADELYINGTLVGGATYQYPQRRYKILPGVLKPGKNIFVIRVSNTAGKGGFVPDKPYYLFAGNDTIDLKGTWQYKVGEVYPLQETKPGPPFRLQYQPTALYNAMIAPVTNYTIKGFCWYQGEGNIHTAEEYTKLLPALISDWRTQWQQTSLPFLIVQLPGFSDYNYYPSESNWAILREAQLKTLTVANTALTVAIDLGEWNDIHPDNKKDVGERLALAALKLAYNKNIVSSGPLYQSSEIAGDKITVHFSNTGSGLVTNDEEAPGDFAIAGADKKFVWATATIEGDNIIVTSDKIKKPLYVRYAWADNPVHPNVYNKEGLPASPFRTDK